MAIKYFVYGIQIFDSAIPTSSHFKDVLLFGSEKMAKARAAQINTKTAARLSTEIALTHNVQEINVTKVQHDSIAKKRNGVWQRDISNSIRKEITNKRAESEKLRDLIIPEPTPIRRSIKRSPVCNKNRKIRELNP